MDLKGKIGTVPLSDVFQMLSRGKSSGILSIHAADGERLVEFQNGAITTASRSDRPFDIAVVLAAQGMVDTNWFAHAEDYRQKNHAPLAEALIQLGAITLEQFHQTLQFQLQEEICDLFLLTDAEFAFRTGEQFHPDNRMGGGVVELAVQPDALLLEAARRMDEWKAVAAKLPDPATLYIVTEQGRQYFESAPPQHRRILQLINEKNTCESILTQSCLGRFQAAQMLLQLQEAGIAREMSFDLYPDIAQEHLQAGRAIEAQRIFVYALKYMQSPKRKTVIMTGLKLAEDMLKPAEPPPLAAETSPVELSGNEAIPPIPATRSARAANPPADIPPVPASGSARASGALPATASRRVMDMHAAVPVPQPAVIQPLPEPAPQPETLLSESGLDPEAGVIKVPLAKAATPPPSEDITGSARLAVETEAERTDAEIVSEATPSIPADMLAKTEPSPKPRSAESKISSRPTGWDPHLDPLQNKLLSAFISTKRAWTVKEALVSATEEGTAFPSELGEMSESDARATFKAMVKLEKLEEGKKDVFWLAKYSFLPEHNIFEFLATAKLEYPEARIVTAARKSLKTSLLFASEKIGACRLSYIPVYRVEFLKMVQKGWIFKKKEEAPGILFIDAAECMTLTFSKKEGFRFHSVVEGDSLKIKSPPPGIFEMEDPGILSIAPDCMEQRKKPEAALKIVEMKYGVKALGCCLYFIPFWKIEVTLKDKPARAMMLDGVAAKSFSYPRGEDG